MAYAAVLSLRQTISPLLGSSPHFSLHPSSQEIIKSAYFATVFLKEALEKLDSSSSWSRCRRSVLVSERKIRELVSEFEVLLESHISKQISSQSQLTTTTPSSFTIDLQHLSQDVDSFIEMVMKMEEEYVCELDRPLSDEEDGDEDRRTDSCGDQKARMVGLNVEFSGTKDVLTWDWGFPSVTIVGMAGIGKTTVAREIYRDQVVVNHFDRRVWVNVGREYRLNNIKQCILAQVADDDSGMMVYEEGDEGKTDEFLKEIFKNKKCLIVLDDVWDTKVKDDLHSLLPKEDNKSRILITTRLHEVAEEMSSLVLMKLLSKEESWELLCEKVFVEKELIFNPELEQSGKKIAEKCDGLPLMIVAVADILSRSEMSPEFWKEVAEKRRNSVFKDAYDGLFEVLVPSYEFLPHYLKPCFLSVGVFPQDYKLSRSKIMNLIIAEGFVEPKHEAQTLEDRANECLEAVASNTLVIIIDQRSTGKFGSIKTCRLHSCLWHMCKRVAYENKFFHVLDSLEDALVEEGMRAQSRLCVHNHVLFGINDVHESMRSHCEFTTHSLLCYGPYHPYPVPICFALRLLRVLDALKVRFFEFRDEVLDLVQLRYLALTCNGDIPKFISKLWNLQFLTIGQHMSIKYVGASKILPIEIWDMNELKYINIIGRDLPNFDCGPSLENLLTLIGVSLKSCAQEVLKRLPNLKKLGIEIALEPNGDTKPLSWFDHISHLAKLESLKCVVVNPEFRFEIVAPPAFHSLFPSSLQKLHLGGLGYPWEYMNTIGMLPNLQVLKLRTYAFRGPKWEIKEDAFKVLQVLVIEDTDLVHWEVAQGGFPMVVLLTIKNCYKIRKIHWEPDNYSFERIDAVDCSPSALSWVNHIKSRREDPLFNSYIHSSWIDVKRK